MVLPTNFPEEPNLS